MIAKLTENYIKILIGDFNINLTDIEDSAKFRELERRNLKSAMKNEIFTTNMNTQIDIICTDTKNYLTGAYESYFSDHKPIFIEIDDEINMKSIYKSIDSNNIQSLPIIKNKKPQAIEDKYEIVNVDEQHVLPSTYNAFKELQLIM